MQASMGMSEFNNKKRKLKGQCWACGKFGHTKMQYQKLQNMANQVLDAEDSDLSSSDSKSKIALVLADLCNMSQTSKK